MIRRLTLRNFRAFKAQKFAFAKINVFIGPNNAGKSSAISAINLLGQTIRENESGAPLVLNGKYHDLGTYIDVVHGNIPRTVMGFELEIDRFAFRVDFKYRANRRQIEIIKYEILYRKDPLFYYKSTKDSYILKYRGRTFEKLLPGASKRRPEFQGILLDDKNIRALTVGPSATSGRFSALQDNERRELINVQQLIFRARRILVSEFAIFDSLGPFREPPRRTYLFSGESPGQVGQTGSNAVDILVSDTFTRGSLGRRLVESVSHWFSMTGTARSVKIKPLTSRHFEVVVIANDGREHNLCDVGFGCSQVLPVLVGGLNCFLSAKPNLPRSHPIFVVQEPEIHLHPDAQAELGTFFKDLISRPGQVFIETHSDTLILRLQRHVAAGDLDAQDLKVFFVRSRRKRTEIINVNLDSLGTFSKELPGGFFPQRQIESFALAKAAALRRRKGDIGERGDAEERSD